MAFQNVNVRNTKKATDLAVGEVLEGYAVRIEESRKHEGTFNLVMQDPETGSQFLLFGAGNIKYALRDGNVAIGLRTRITREEDTKIKGMKSSSFKIEQDPSDTLGDSVAFAALGSTGTDSNVGTVANTPSTPESIRAATERNIKAQASKLSASMKRG